MTDAEKNKAAAMVAGWYWQPVDGHNYRYDRAIRTLTRYYETAPVASDALQLVLEYLRSVDPGDTIDLLGKKVNLGSGWKTRDAWYQTVSGDDFKGTESARVRIYQTLALYPTGADVAPDGPYYIDNGCQYRIKRTYYWNIPALPTLPLGSSGVEYSMPSVTRDETDGLYNCIIECRVRQQQDVAQYMTVKTVSEERYEEQHLGVVQTSVAGTGKSASCGNGRIVKRRIVKNPDCTSNVENETVVEIADAGAVVETRRGLRATTTSTVARNQTAALSASGLAVGETRKSEKTEGGRYNNTTQISTVGAASVAVSGECSATSAVHTDTATVAVPVAQAVAQHVTAEPNKEKSVSYRRNDDGVTADSTTVTRTWSVTTGSGASVSGDVVSVTTERRNNTTTVPTAPSAAVNRSVDIDATPNDHGSYSTTVRTTTYAQKSTGKLTSGSAVVRSEQKSSVNVPTVSSPGQGAVNVVRRISASPNDHGSFTVSETTDTYLEHSTGDVSAGSAATAVVSKTSVNVQTVESPGQGAANVVRRISASPNDHGSFTVSETTETYSPVSATSVSTWATEIATTTTTRNNTDVSVAAARGSASATPDDKGAATTSVTEFTPIAVDSGWITWSSTVKSSSGTYEYEHGVRIFKNLSAPPAVSGKTDVKLAVSINRFGLFDGQISYSFLKTWSQSSSGGSSGGSRTGNVVFWEYKRDNAGRRYVRKGYLPTISYFGSGNEGSRASSAANAYIVPGVSLPFGTFGTGAPSYTAWELQS